MQRCQQCGHEESEWSRFCTRCGTPLRADTQRPASSTGVAGRAQEELNISILYVMVALLILALLIPPWETPPGQSPEFLGFHPILAPPPAGAESGVISRLLLTIELVTIAVAGLYLSWLFRKQG